MSTMTYEQLVDLVAKAIDPHAEARDNLGYTIGGVEYARKVARDAIATIAEATKEPTGAMERDQDGYELRHYKVEYLVELGWIGDSEGRTWAKDLKESTAFPTKEAADAYVDNHPEISRDRDGWLRTKYEYGQVRIRRSEVLLPVDVAYRAMHAASLLYPEEE